MIDDTVTDGIFSSTGTEYSQETVPSGNLSEIVIELVSDRMTGKIFLEKKTPNGDWIPAISPKSGTYVIYAPDTSITYRFRANQHTGQNRVYFGA